MSWPALRALVLLTGAMLQRLAREGLVVRSLTFPTGLTVGTLVLTIGIVALFRWSPLISLSPDLAELAPLLEENGMHTMVTADPRGEVEAGRAWAGSDGHHLWTAGGGPQMVILEAVLREHAGADWRPDADVPPPPATASQAMGGRILILLGALFALYGVVFGAGMVARDRDNGTLEIELALPVPRWVHGAARLATGTLALSAFLALGILMVDAVMGVANAGALIRHGIACAGGATGIGLLAIGRGGLTTGFTGPLATGMSLATGLFAFGLAAPGVARWIPLASFSTSSSGWEALAGTALFAVLVVGVFTWRSARA